MSLKTNIEFILISTYYIILTGTLSRKEKIEKNNRLLWKTIFGFIFFVSIIEGVLIVLRELLCHFGLEESEHRTQMVSKYIVERYIAMCERVLYRIKRKMTELRIKGTEEEKQNGKENLIIRLNCDDEDDDDEECDVDGDCDETCPPNDPDGYLNNNTKDPCRRMKCKNNWMRWSLTAQDTIGEGAEKWKNGLFYYGFAFVDFFILVDTSGIPSITKVEKELKRPIPRKFVRDVVDYILDTPFTKEKEYKNKIQKGHLETMKRQYYHVLELIKFKQETKLLRKLNLELFGLILEANVNPASTSHKPNAEQANSWKTKMQLLEKMEDLFRRYLKHFKFMSKNLHPHKHHHCNKYH